MLPITADGHEPESPESIIETIKKIGGQKKKGGHYCHSTRKKT